MTSTQPPATTHIGPPEEHGLFEVFMPRRMCMKLEPDVIGMHVAADCAIAVAYFTIPFALVVFVRRRRDLSFNWVFWLFALFIVLCGVTHLFSVLAIWKPLYRLDGIFKLATALASLGTAASLWRFMPKALALPSTDALSRANQQLADEVARRKEAELQLADSNRLLEQRVQERTAELESLLTSAPLGLAVFDRNHCYLRVNSVLAEINGRSTEEHLGRSLTDVVPANAAAVAPIIDRVFTTGEALANIEIEGQTALRPGVVRHWLTGFYPIRLASQQVYAVGAWVIEISERKAVEERLRASEARFRAVVEAVPGQFWTASPDGEIEYVGPWMPRYAGIQADALAGWQWLSVLHPDDVQMATEAWKRALASGEPFRVDFRVRGADGGFRWLRNEAHAQRDDSGHLVKWFGYSADVDAIKRAEAELRLSERRERERADEIEAIMRTAPAAIWIAQDAECQRITGNPESYRLLRMQVGQNASASGAANNSEQRPFREFRDGRPLEPEELPMQLAARTGTEVTGAELELRFDDGTVRHVYGDASPLLDSSGHVRGAVGTFIDITPLKCTTAALEKRERQLQAVADHTPDILARFDRNLRHVFVNAQGSRVLGRPAQDFIGRSNRELGLPLALCEPLERALSLVFATGQAQELEFSWGAPAGERHFVSRVVPERAASGDVEHVLAVTTDVTDRTIAENEARHRASEAEQARRILEGIMEHVPEGITVADAPDVSVRMMSRYGAHLSGGSLRAQWAAPAKAEQVAAEEADLPLERAVRFGEIIVNEEWDIVRGDGSRVPVLCNAGPIRDASGDIVGGVIAFRDITDLKRALAELREANVRKDEFLATLAHELRNPLAPLRSGIELLSRGAPGSHERIIAIMDRQLSHTVRLIDDLLDISRVTTGKVVLQLDTIAMQSAVELAVEATRPIIDASKHILQLHVPNEPVWVDGDLTRLGQVISNLLTNAAKYTPNGGTIALRLWKQSESAFVSVTDTGLGIPSDMLSKVFEMFTQINRNLHRSQGGLGIGLALVKRLVEMHGGTIRAESQGANQGSTFTVSIPLVAAALTSEAPGERSLPDQRTQLLPILIVDDNEDAADTLSMLLEQWGYEVRTAYDGTTALALFSERPPKIALLDLGMPGMSGHEVARRMREQLGRNVFLIALTGWGSAAAKLETEAAGFDRHLTKPVDTGELHDLLAELGKAATSHAT